MDEGKRALIPIPNEQLVSAALTDDDVQKIHNKMWRLLAHRTDRYTMGDSSSVSVETAEELLKSISFTIAVYLKASGSPPSLLLECDDIQKLMDAGWLELKAQMETGKKLFHEVIRCAPQVDNRSYHDTIEGIGTFFRKYDYRFFAHMIPCDIDYQLCHAVSEELQGIEYINEYLKRLYMENTFCNQFEVGMVISLLKRYCPDYEGLLINMFEPVAVNAIGLALRGGAIACLDMTPYDRRELLARFNKWSKADAMRELRAAADKVCAQLSMEDGFSIKYLRKTARDLYPRITAALPSGSLEGIFLSLA